KSLTLPSVDAELVDVLLGQCTCKRPRDPAKLRAGQRSLLVGWCGNPINEAVAVPCLRSNGRILFSIECQSSSMLIQSHKAFAVVVSQCTHRRANMSTREIGQHRATANSPRGTFAARMSGNAFCVGSSARARVSRLPERHDGRCTALSDHGRAQVP